MPKAKIFGIIGRSGFCTTKDEEMNPCKETLAMWAKLGMDYRKIKCNCVW